LTVWFAAPSGDPAELSVRHFSMSKAKVILARERGNNLGHISGLVALSCKVTASFAKSVWVLPGAKRRQIPSELMFNDIREPPALSPSPDFPRRRPYTYAEVLAWPGFANRPALHAGLREWRQLLEEIEPALVVVDGAPTAQLAAYLFGWKCVQLSNDFHTPPSHCPPFGFGLRGSRIDDGNRRLIADLNQNISDVAVSLGGLRSTSLAGCMEETTRLVARVAETDRYGGRNDVSYVGPVTWLGATESAVWPAAGSAIGVLSKEVTVEAAQKVASRYSGENWEARLWQGVVEAGGFSPEGQVLLTMKGVL